MSDPRTPFWKKEISLRRKPKDDRARAEKQSLWKKEIRLLPRRQPKPVGYLAPEMYARGSRTPFWKKEITLRRKPRAEHHAAEPQVQTAASVESKTPFWKKEITLRRKPKASRKAAPMLVSPPPLPADGPSKPAAPVDAAASSESLPTPVPRPFAPAPPADDSDEETVTFDLDLPDDDENPLPPAAQRFPSVHDVPEPEFVHEAAPDAGLAFETEIMAPAASSEPFASAPASPPHPEQAAFEPAESRGPFALPVSESADPAAEKAVRDEVDGQPQEQQKRFSRAGRSVRRAAAKDKRTEKKAKKIVGLKIGASQIAAARVANNGSAELLQVAREPLESGIVVAGELRDPESLATALKAFFKKNKLPTRGIRLGLSNNRIGVRIFDIAGIDDPEQLRNAVRFRAQETLPIPIDEAVLDYHVLGESVDEEGVLTRRVLLVVAYRDLIDRYVTACRKAGLRLVGIDLEAFALLRALGNAPSPDANQDRVGLVVVSVGHDRSTFAVSDGRVCEFARVLDWGGYSLNVAIARALDLTPVEAEPIKLGLSLTDKAVVPHGLTTEQADAAREAVLTALEGFARDLVSSLRFYQSQPNSLGIRELILTGGTGEMPGLAAELERLIGVYVRVGDPLGRVKVARRVKQPERVGSFAAAIGLGIED